MLHYFETQTGKDLQIALQKDVSSDIRDYLKVADALKAMVFGYYGLEIPAEDKKRFYALNSGKG